MDSSNESKQIEVELQPGEQVLVFNPEKAALAAQMISGAGWFNTVGFLSLINTVLILTHIKFYFVFSLGITAVATVFSSSFDYGTALALLFTWLGASGAFFFGRFARSGFAWAFKAGMLLFALDALIFVFFQSWLEVGCHAFALWHMARGLSACNQLQRRFGSQS